MRRTGLYGLFFLSGVSALIYELIWQRLLVLVFGVSTLSVSAVLAAFMGGLALGGLLCGRLADRAKRPFRLYAFVELGIGLASLAVPPAFVALTSVYTSLHTQLHLGQWGGTCLRFVMACVVLLLPATLIGATFPIMGRLSRKATTGLPTTFSVLYAVNTFGGVLGAALTGFLLLRTVGMQQTLWLAAGLNFLVAVAALLIQATAKTVANDCPLEPATLKDSQERARSCAPALALGLAASTGAVSMAFEVGWSRILGILTSNSAYGFALILCVMLFGLGVGGAIQWRWSRRAGDNWQRLAICQWLLAAVLIATLPFFRTAPAWFDRWCDGSSVAGVFVGELLLTAGALLPAAVLMGMSLPLLVAGVASSPAHFGSWLGRIYAANTLGCFVGAFATGFILIPLLGIHNTFAITLVVIGLAGLLAWQRAERPAHTRPGFVAIPVYLAGIAIWVLAPSGQFLKSPVQEPRQVLFYLEGNNATVSVLQEHDGVRSVFVDGQPVAGTVGTSRVDQKMLAHLPLLLHPAPERALTVGFGSGGTSYSMTLHGIDVDCVEIEGAVPAAAPLFDSENHGILAYPRYRLILDDARSWLRVAPRHYDVIATDCTNIQYRSNGDLYTVEYFRLMRDRLTATGVAAAWVPANGIGDRDLRTLLRSFREVFPHTSVWFMNSMPTDFLIVIGTPELLKIDFEQLSRRLRAPAILHDLDLVGLKDPCRLLYTFLAEGAELANYLGSGDLNTDDRPVLSYSTYGAAFQSTIAANLARLLACRKDIAPLVTHPAPRTTMLRHYVASNELILGHIAHLAGTEESAVGHYRRAAQLLQADMLALEK